MELARQLIDRHGKLDAARASWKTQWDDVLAFCMPQEGRALGTNNDGEERPRPVDGTGIRAKGVLASGLYSNTYGSGEKWFDLRPSDPRLSKSDEARRWFADARDIALRAIQNSNFATIFHGALEKFCVLGTPVVYCEWSAEKRQLVFREFSIVDCCLAESAAGTVDTVFRPIVERVVGLLIAAGVIPAPPEELEAANYDIVYTTRLDARMKAIEGQALLRVIGAAAQVAQAQQAIPGAALLFDLQKITRFLAEAEAHELALSKTFGVIERTQQSASVLDRAEWFRRGNAATRLIAQFGGAIAQAAAYEVRALQQVKANPKNAAAWKRLGEVALVNHVIVPGINWLVTELVRPGDDDEEEARARLFAAMVAGPASGIFLLGALAQGSVEAFFGGGGFGGPRAVPADKVLRDAATLAAVAAEVKSGDWDTAGEKALKLLFSLVPPARQTRDIVEQVQGGRLISARL